MVNGIKDLSVHSVLVFDWLTRPGYVHDLTLERIKLHIQCFFPTLAIYLGHFG